MPVDAAAAYRGLAPAVLGYLRAQAVADPEDVLGEVFLQVARDAHKFRGDDAAVRSWIFSIAHNRAIDSHRRRHRRRRRTNGDVVPLEDSTDLAAPARDDELVDPALVAALRQLTDDQRNVVVLRFVADLSLEAVAKLTGKKVGAVKALQHRAIQALAEILNSPVSPEDPRSLTWA